MKVAVVGIGGWGDGVYNKLKKLEEAEECAENCGGGRA
jgi:hypothetical protein